MLKEKQCNNVYELVKYLVDEDKLCGFNMAIVTPDEEFVRTYGYRQKVEKLLPAERDTIYDLASLSKVVSTTTCMLKLMENGEITLDTTIHSVLPEFANEEVTVRECMTHTTGLIDVPEYKKLNDEEFLHALHNMQPDPKLKGNIFYSDTNYILLGFVIDRLKGSLKDFAEETVFKPLGMDHTCYQPTDKSNCAATEVTEKRGVICGEVHDGKAFRLNGIAGSAGVFSNIDDLIKFVRMIMNDNDPYLKPETREMIRTCYADKGADRRSLGWIISTDKATMGIKYSEHTLFHTGFTGGHIMIDLDRKMAIILLCNRIHPNRNNTSILKFRDVINTLAIDCVD